MSVSLKMDNKYKLPICMCLGLILVFVVEFPGVHGDWTVETTKCGDRIFSIVGYDDVLYLGCYDKYGNVSGIVAKFDYSGTFLDRIETKDAMLLNLDVTSDGVFECGYTYGNLTQPNLGDRDWYIRKMSHNLTTVWIHQYGTSGGDYATRFVLMNDTMYVVGASAGNFGGSGSLAGTPGFLSKVNAVDGTIDFSVPILAGQDASVLNPERMVGDGKGNLYVVGTISSGHTFTSPESTTAVGNGDVFLLKTTLSFSHVWVKQFGTTYQDLWPRLAMDSYGYIWVSYDYTQSATGRWGMQKFNVDGATLKQDTYGFSSSSAINELCPDNSGHVYGVGATWANLPNNPPTTGQDMMLQSVDNVTLETRIWRSWGGPDDERARACLVVGETIYVAGFSDEGFAGNGPGVIALSQFEKDNTPCAANRVSRGIYTDPLPAISTEACPVCPAGQRLSDQKDNCQQCQKGEFSNQGSVSCSECPSGKFGNATGQTSEASACFQCPNGQFQSSTGASSCVACPAGYAGTGIGKTSQQQGCSLCNKGTYAPEGSTACQNCPGGQYGNIKGQTNIAGCLTCDKGEYSTAGGSSTCTQCPTGTFGNITGQSSQSLACFQCVLGTFSTQPGSTTCDTCPAGFKGKLPGKSSQSDGCSRCDPGSYSTTQASTTCQQCAPGKFGNTSQATSEQQACFQCPEGSFSSSSGASSCTPCPSGTFGNITGQSSQSLACFHCPKGTYQPVPGSTTCVKCAAGRFGTNPGQSSEENACQPCTKGSFSTNPGSTTCQQCAPGTFGTGSSAVNGTLACQSCDQGSFSTSSGVSECTKCNLGSFGNNTGSTSIGEACFTCPKGAFSASQGSPICTQCPPGKFGNQTGRTSEQSACFECPKSTYSNTPGSTICQQCTAGKFGETTGQSSESNACQDCKKGQYSLTPASTSCQQCSLGKFGNTTGQSTETIACHPCPLGSFSKYNGETTCQLCEKGTFGLGAGLSNRAAACQNCPSGKYSTLDGATGCTACAKGSKGTSAGQSSLENACQTCAAGSYSTQDGSNTCLLCPAGKFGNATGQTSLETACYPCPLGSYSSDNGSSSCQQCPAGYKGIAAGETSQSSACQQCAIGSYSDQSGSTNCTSCPLGKYGKQPGQPSLCLACFDCSRGLYSDTTGSTGCKKCNAGTYGNSSALTSASECINCPNGKYSTTDGATGCDLCGLGTRGTGPGKSSSAQACQDCEIGYFSATFGAISCTQCANGKSNSEKGSTVCSSCSGGQFHNTTINACQPCPHGHYQTGVGQSQCIPCSPGSHQPNIGGTDCIACLPGTYQSSSGQSSCLPCDSDKICPAASSSQLSCPSGTQKPAGATQLSQCILVPDLTGSVSSPGSASLTGSSRAFGAFGSNVVARSSTGIIMNTTSIALAIPKERMPGDAYIWVPPNGNRIQLMASWNTMPSTDMPQVHRTSSTGSGYAILKVPTSDNHTNANPLLFSTAINMEVDRERKEYEIDTVYVSRFADAKRTVQFTDLKQNEFLWLDLNSPNTTDTPAFERGDKIRVTVQASGLVNVWVYHYVVRDLCQQTGDQIDLNGNPLEICSYTSVPGMTKAPQSGQLEYVPFVSRTVAANSFTFVVNDSSPVFMRVRPLTDTKQVQISVEQIQDFLSISLFAGLTFVYAVVVFYSYSTYKKQQAKRNRAVSIGKYILLIMSFADILSDTISVFVNIETAPLLAMLSGIFVGCPLLFRVFMVVRTVKRQGLRYHYQNKILPEKKESRSKLYRFFTRLMLVIDLENYYLLLPFSSHIDNFPDFWEKTDNDLPPRYGLADHIKFLKLMTSLFEDIPQVILQVLILQTAVMPVLVSIVVYISLGFSGLSAAYHLFKFIKMLVNGSASELMKFNYVPTEFVNVVPLDELDSKETDKHDDQPVRSAQVSPIEQEPDHDLEESRENAQKVKTIEENERIKAEMKVKTQLEDRQVHEHL